MLLGEMQQGREGGRCALVLADAGCLRPTPRAQLGDNMPKQSLAAARHGASRGVKTEMRR